MKKPLKQQNQIVLCDKAKDFDATTIHGSRETDVFVGDGNPGDLKTRDRYCFCSGVQPLQFHNNNQPIGNTCILIKKTGCQARFNKGDANISCLYTHITGVWEDKTTQVKQGAGRRVTRSRVGTIERTNEQERKKARGEMKVNDIIMKPFPNVDYQTIINSVRPTLQDKKVTYQIGRVVKKTFQTQVSKHKLILNTNIISTVRKNSYVCLVEFAKPTDEKKLFFRFDSEDLRLLEVGETNYDPVITADPIKIKYTKGNAEFQMDRDSHKMLQTLDIPPDA